MKPRSPQSMQLYKMLLSRGYPESFCDLVTKNLNTDFTASRMIGYLCHYSDLPPEEIADEMLAILSDRNRIMQKKELESNNAEWNRILMRDWTRRTKPEEINGFVFGCHCSRFRL